MANIRYLPSSQRDQLAKLLNPHSAADATASYYALSHPADRIKLVGYCPGDGPPTGFVVQARTGLDLFRPLLVPFVGHPTGLVALLRAVLRPSTPVILCLPEEQRDWVEPIAELGAEPASETLRMDPRVLEPVVSVLLEVTRSPDGFPRYRLDSKQGVRVMAGVNWSGARFSEIYIEVEPPVKARGFARSVLANIAGHLLIEDKKVALLRVSDGQPMIREEALQVGFRPTGVRLLYTQAVLREIG